MKKSSIQPFPRFFDRYINLVEDIDIIDALQKYHVSFFQAEYKNLKALSDTRYAEGKWTIKEILQHVVDTERVMAYRALRLGRKDPTPLPGFDQDVFGASTNTHDRTVGEILKEFELVREANIMMFKNFDEDKLMYIGTCNNTQISTLALGFVMAGHTIHHLNVIKEKYYTLL